MFTRTNIVATRFAKCSVVMHIKLFKVFACMVLVYGLDSKRDLQY